MRGHNYSVVTVYYHCLLRTFHCCLSVCLSVCHYMSAIRSDDIIRFKYDQCVTTGTSVVRLLKTGDNAA